MFKVNQSQKKILFLFYFLSPQLFAQNLAPLTVEKIMQDPKWIGVSPTNVFWSEDSKTLYFNWNPELNKGDSLYKFTGGKAAPQKVSRAERMALPSQSGSYNKSRMQKVFVKNGDIFLLNIASGKTRLLTATNDFKSNPVFSGDEQKIIFTQNGNLFARNLADGELRQLTDFRKGKKPETAQPAGPEKWLKNDQLAFFEVLKERKEKRELTEKFSKAEQPKRLKEIYTDEKNAANLTLSPDEKFVLYTLSKTNAGKGTVVPNYVTESGFTEELPARTKVGNPPASNELYIFDRQRDTVFQFSIKDLPGINDLPDYVKDYPAKKDTGKAKKPESRKLIFGEPSFSPDGSQAVVIARSVDNKDVWLLKINPADHILQSLERIRDEAWVNFFNGLSPVDWLDNQTIAFISEKDGFMHLYTLNVASGEKKQRTKGNFEVQQALLSRDKKTFYLLTNQEHPGEKHIYKLPVSGGTPAKISTLKGANEMYLSPDEKQMATRRSSSNQPWELYVQENKPNTQPRQVTSSLSDEFKSYNWREPEIISFKATDGTSVFARLYKPSQPNGAAVIFVHGAGYLQNAHKWWSQYFREYMFHNLLTDKGFTVMDVDYRGSAGYGRDFRTGIYRFMGGKDLTDHLDAANLLTGKYGIDARRIGIYGGSYGGFITLMAMFTKPEVFRAGAALRPVTDWSHYNHGYTANILNEPVADSLAYRRSSPIYHAGGLKGHLLICHGMVDVNVHFQDVVRLSQRLIELKKENWELAAYPVEDHGFVEPSSWTDEYKRILKLFETTLLPQER
jgi:dipeptidyl aminopeptidase/acylaminoacyl peptidase